MANKSMIIQYFFLISIYGVIFVLIWIKKKVEELMLAGLAGDAQNLTFIAGFGIFAYFMVAVLLFVWDYEKIRTECTSVERINFTIRDLESTFYYESIGILDKWKIKVSKKKVEDCFNNPEIARMFQDMRERLKNKYKKDIEEVLLPEEEDNPLFDDKNNKKKKKKNSGKPYSLPWKNILSDTDIDFASYDIDLLMISEIKNFFTPEVLKFLSDEKQNEVKAIKSKNDFISLTKDELVIITKKLKEKNNIDIKFELKQELIRDSENKFEFEEIKFFKEQGIHNLQDLLECNKKDIEEKFNLKFLKDLNPLAKKTKYYNFKEDIEIFFDDFITKESYFLYNLSDDARMSWVTLKTARIKALYFNYSAYFVITDYKFPLAVDVIKGNTNSRKSPKDMVYIKVNTFLLVLPEDWGVTFEFKKRRIFYKGHFIKTPHVTDANFIYRCMLTHNVGVLLCSNSDYIQEQMTNQIKIEKQTLDEVEKMALVDIVNTTMAKSERLGKKISDRDKRIKEYKRGNDEKFVSLLSDMNNKTWQFNYNAPKKINVSTVILMILIGIVFFFVGYVIARNQFDKPGEVIETTQALISIVYNNQALLSMINRLLVI